MAGSSIRLICPNLRCRALLSVPPTARGKKVRCRQCGTRIEVPDKPKPKPSTPAPAADAAND